MIIVGGKFKGKKLANAIINAIRKEGIATVAALSDGAVLQVNKAGQNVANELGASIAADPKEGHIELDGVERIALVVEFKIGEENPDA